MWFEENIVELMNTLKEDQAGGFSNLMQEGHYLYTVTISHSTPSSNEFEALVHVQWSRLHQWINTHAGRGQGIEMRHYAYDVNNVHVRARRVGGNVVYMAIIDRPELIELLEERGVPVGRNEAAEDMWNNVLKYECL